MSHSVMIPPKPIMNKRETSTIVDSTGVKVTESSGYQDDIVTLVISLGSKQ